MPVNLGEKEAQKQTNKHINAKELLFYLTLDVEKGI